MPKLGMAAILIHTGKREKLAGKGFRVQVQVFDGFTGLFFLATGL